MTSRLEILRQIIDCHHTIRSDIQRVDQCINDLEVLFRIRGEYAALSQSSLADLEIKKDKMRETFKTLESSLQKHFDHEEKCLPAILGEVLIKGLVVEHKAIREEIRAANDIIFSTIYDSTVRNEPILLKSQLQQTITNLGQHIERHASREEIVLDMAREGLEG